MFLGAFEHTLDSKGRLSLPARYRELLAAQGDLRLIVTCNVDPGAACLVGYTPSEWSGFQQRINDLPQFDEHVIRLKRLHVAGATECVADRQGRIFLPSFLREYAALKSSVIFAGLGKQLEIWDRERWQAEREQAKKSLPEINQALARFGL